MQVEKVRKVVSDNARDLSPRGVLVDEGFQDSGDLLLLRAREPRGGFE